MVGAIAAEALYPPRDLTRPRRGLLAALPIVGLAMSSMGCQSFMSSATRTGMMPILRNGIDEFVSEPDLDVAEGAIVANMKLIEGVAATYPDDPEPATMAAMARANYAFGFIVDELEAVRLAYPDDAARAEALLARAIINFAKGRSFAERALADEGDWAEVLAGKSLESIDTATLDQAMADLDEASAPALFWLAFNWGGALQASLDPAAATQLPKIERIVARVIALDEKVFYGAGPHLMAGTLHGFRAPALGGNPTKATTHFAKATELGGGILLPSVMTAQYVFAQSEKPEEFHAALAKVIDAKSNPGFGALEALAKRKACRLWANSDQYFLDDVRPLPDGCKKVGHKHRLREPE